MKHQDFMQNERDDAFKLAIILYEAKFHLIVKKHFGENPGWAAFYADLCQAGEDVLNETIGPVRSNAVTERAVAKELRLKIVRENGNVGTLRSVH